MIKIKLKRIGRKNRAFFQVIISKTLSSTKGKFIEKLGYFDPLTNISKNTKLNIERIKYWIKNGALISKRVKFLIKKYRQ